MMTAISAIRSTSSWCFCSFATRVSSSVSMPVPSGSTRVRAASFAASAASSAVPASPPETVVSIAAEVASTAPASSPAGGSSSGFRVVSAVLS